MLDLYLMEPPDMEEQTAAQTDNQPDNKKDNEEDKRTQPSRQSPSSSSTHSNTHQGPLPRHHTSRRGTPSTASTHAPSHPASSPSASSLQPSWTPQTGYATSSPPGFTHPPPISAYHYQQSTEASQAYEPFTASDPLSALAAYNQSTQPTYPPYYSAAQPSASQPSFQHQQSHQYATRGLLALPSSQANFPGPVLKSNAYVTKTGESPCSTYPTAPLEATPCSTSPYPTSPYSTPPYSILPYLNDTYSTSPYLASASPYPTSTSPYPYSTSVTPTAPYPPYIDASRSASPYPPYTE